MVSFGALQSLKPSSLLNRQVNRCIFSINDVLSLSRSKNQPRTVWLGMEVIGAPSGLALHLIRKTFESVALPR